MDGPARFCAIVTGSVASLCVAVSLSWWFDPAFGQFSAFAVAFIAFLTGFLGFFVMFGMAYVRGRDFTRTDFFNPVKARPRRLRNWLALLALVAVVTAGFAWNQEGQWSAAAPYTEAPGCHWPLYANHDTEHMCVSHSRWLTVKSADDRIFFGFGVIFLVVDTAAFTAISRQPRHDRKRAMDARRV